MINTKQSDSDCPKKGGLFWNTENHLDFRYDLELERVAREINKNKARLVCIQFPDGLKQKAEEIAYLIEKETNATVLIWMGSCFGACDIPTLPKEVGMLIQFGHNGMKQDRKLLKA